MLWSVDSCQNRVSADQYHLTIPWAQVSTHRGRVFFRSYSQTNYQFQMITGSNLFFPMIHMKYVVFMSLWPCTVMILISNWPRTRKFSQFFKNTGGEDLFLPRSRIGHVLRPILMLWLVKIWQVSSCGKFIQHLETCLLWQLKLTEFWVNLWCFLMSFSTGCTKWNTAAIKSLLLFMAGLFIGFLVEKCITWQNSVIWFRMASFSFFTLLNA